MKPTLDEQGRLVPREDYRISTLNCGEEDFAVACMRSNLRYGKNQKREDVKSHHYIISFDPRDGPDNGLTVDRAQELGERFCKEQFPGHQALVCTHPDGHNHSGNIHVHMVVFPQPQKPHRLQRALPELHPRLQAELPGNRCPLPPLLVQTVEAAGWGSKTAPHPWQRATVFQRTPVQRIGVSCFTTAPTHTEKPVQRSVSQWQITANITTSS